MGKEFDSITPELAEWIGSQRLFFVSTAPMSSDGLINCSPKGLDSFRILGAKQVAYLDLTGSGIETLAHLKENGRIVLMFCAFIGAPKIVRLHGRGIPLLQGTSEFDNLKSHFPEIPGARAIIRVDVRRISESCGYGVPRYEFMEERDTLVRWAESKSDEGLEEYRCQKNSTSLDGLPGWDRSET